MDHTDRVIEVPAPECSDRGPLTQTGALIDRRLPRVVPVDHSPVKDEAVVLIRRAGDRKPLIDPDRIGKELAQIRDIVLDPLDPIALHRHLAFGDGVAELGLVEMHRPRALGCVAVVVGSTNKQSLRSEREPGTKPRPGIPGRDGNGLDHLVRAPVVRQEVCLCCRGVIMSYDEHVLIRRECCAEPSGVDRCRRWDHGRLTETRPQSRVHRNPPRFIHIAGNPDKH